MSDQSTAINTAPQEDRSGVSATTQVALLSISRDVRDHQSVETVFSNPGWLILKAISAPDARATLRRTKIAVLLCDHDSMGSECAEILNHVRELSNQPSVIITSRLADDALWTRALQAGAWDVLRKPFSRAELLRSVRYAWEHSRQQHTDQA